MKTEILQWTDEYYTYDYPTQAEHCNWVHVIWPAAFSSKKEHVNTYKLVVAQATAESIQENLLQQDSDVERYPHSPTLSPYGVRTADSWDIPIQP